MTDETTPGSSMTVPGETFQSGVGSFLEIVLLEFVLKKRAWLRFCTTMNTISARNLMASHAR